MRFFSDNAAAACPEAVAAIADAMTRYYQPEPEKK